MNTIHLSTPKGIQSQHEEYQLRAMWEQGLIEDGSLYWIDGMVEWSPVSELFQSTPPVITPPSICTPTHPTYIKDPKSLTKWLIIMLWISLVAEIVMILSDFAQISLLNRVYTEAEAEANDTRQALISMGYFGVFLFNAIVFLKWMHRANLNCRGFGAEGMNFTPGWCVGWFFVPFLNLVRPYQAMKEIWQVSHDPKYWKSAPGSSLLGCWWALWILSSVLGQIVFRTSMHATTIDEIQRSTVFSIISSFVGIHLCLVVIRIVKSISKMQDRIVNPD